MRILICDDDPLIIEQLQKFIESFFKSNHIKCPELVSFTSGESLLADSEEKDLVFLVSTSLRIPYGHHQKHPPVVGSG